MFVLNKEPLLHRVSFHYLLSIWGKECWVLQGKGNRCYWDIEGQNTWVRSKL